MQILKRLSWLIVALFVLVAILGFVVFAIFQSHESLREDIVKELAKVLLQLAVIGIASVVIKYLVEQHKDEIRRQQALGRLRRVVLRRLTSAYRDVIRARDLIEGNRSAKTYGEQMMVTIPGVQAKLADTQNDIMIRGAFLDSDRIKGELLAMEAYANELIAEYRKNYQDKLVPTQRICEESGDYRLCLP